MTAAPPQMQKEERMSQRRFEIHYNDGRKVICLGARQVAYMLGISIQRVYYCLRNCKGVLSNHQCTIRLVEHDRSRIASQPSDRSKLNTVPNMVDIVMRQMSGDISAPRKAWGDDRVYKRAYEPDVKFLLNNK